MIKFIGGLLIFYFCVEGTGKTTTARKMGQVFYDMGFLSSTQVVECSTSDLVGQYVGETGPKTQQLFEKALGRVLFIDEAYRLSEGHFAKEAMDELVGILTQDRYRAKLVVILAGYDREMDELMARNTGLTSRFPEEIKFHNMSPVQCLEVLKRKLSKQSIRVDALEDPLSTEYKRMVDLLAEISNLPFWGNARDVETLSKQMAAIVFSTPSLLTTSTAENPNDLLTLSGDKAVECIESMRETRMQRASIPARPSPIDDIRQMFQENQAPTSIRTTQTAEQSSPPPLHPEQNMVVNQPAASEVRDAGVTDGIWRQLQIDKQRVEDALKGSQDKQRLLEREIQDAAEREEAAKVQQTKLAEVKAKDDGERAELLRQREEARLREHAARVERAKRAAAMEEEKRKEREEARVQSKIRQMGMCVAGFRWIKQASGYRCAGGSHFIDNAALGI